MTERSQWTEYKMNKQIGLYKQRTAEHNRLRQTVMRKHSPSMYMHTQHSKKERQCLVGVFVQHAGEEVTVRKIG